MIAGIFGAIAFSIAYFEFAPWFLRTVNKYIFKTDMKIGWNLFEIAKR